MPRDISGVMQRLANTTAVTGTVVSSTAYNSLIDDIITEFNNASYLTGLIGPVVTSSVSKVAMKGITTSSTTYVFLTEDGAQGLFKWDSSIPIATHQADTKEAIYIPPSASADGAFIRQDTHPVIPTWYGVNADNVAIAASALTGLFSQTGSEIELQKGTYNISGGDTITMGSDSTVAGGTGTKIVVNSATTTVKTDFAVSADNVSFSGFNVEHDGPDSETAFVFNLQADGTRVSSLKVSGGNTTGNNIIQAFRFDDNDVNNVRIKDSEFGNLNRLFIRDNAHTGNLKNFWFASNYVHDLGQGGAQFNFPNGSVKGVAVVDNYFDTFHAGSERIFSGGASINQAIFSRNIYTGLANEAIHLEEDAQDIIVTSNLIVTSADASNNGHGITVTDNDISGVYAHPERLIVANNIKHNQGTKENSIGYKAPENSTGPISADNVIISNNIYKNYNIGIQTGAGDHFVVGNIVEDCNEGMRVFSAEPNINGNIIKNCPKGINVVARGGLVGKNTFVNVTNAVETMLGELCSMSGFIVKSDTLTTLPSGASYVNIGLSAGSRFRGTAKAHVYFSPTEYHHRISTFSYDGTTITDQQLERVGAGPITFLGLRNNSGQIALYLDNTTGGNRDILGFTVEFDGLWVSAS